MKDIVPVSMVIPYYEIHLCIITCRSLIWLLLCLTERFIGYIINAWVFLFKFKCFPTDFLCKKRKLNEGTDFFIKKYTLGKSLNSLISSSNMIKIYLSGGSKCHKQRASWTVANKKLFIDLALDKKHNLVCKAMHG